jgi:hypothetical protein
VINGIGVPPYCRGGKFILCRDCLRRLLYDPIAHKDAPTVPRKGKVKDSDSFVDRTCENYLTERTKHIYIPVEELQGDRDTEQDRGGV